MRKKSLLGLVAIPLIAIGSLTYATDNEFIVHDTASGTITVYSQDYSYGITIQDKNLGAENVGDYGYYFQWGNNHGNYAGTNTGPQNELLEANVNDWVNTGYIGGNDKFIIFNNGNNNTYDYRSGVYYTSASDNSYTGTYAMGPYNNLRGGGNDNDDSNSKIVKGYDTEKHTATNTGGRQGPCGEGYHVPSAGEWQELMMLRCNANPDICSGSVINTQNGECARANYLNKSGIGTTAFSNDLQLPLAGYRSYRSGAVLGQGSYAYYWSSSPRGGSYPERAWYLYFNSYYVNPSSIYNRAYGQSIRCFKNSYVELPKTLNLFFMSDDEEVGTGEVTENITGAVPEEAKNVTKTGYVLEYRFLSGADASTGFDFETTPISGAWADENDNVYFIAQWTPIIYTISFSGNAADATGTAPATINAEYDSGDIAPDNTFTMTGYTFTGWNTESDGSGTGYVTGAELKNLTTTGGSNVELYAQWEVNVHKLNFVVDGTNIQSGDVAYSSGISAFLPSEPKKDCNNFAGWTSNVEGLTTTGTMPDSDVTFTANWNYTCSRSSGGGGSSRSSSSTANTQDSSTSSQNDDKTQNSSAEASEGQDNTQVDSSANASEGQYSEEFQQAYEFAYKHGITTMDSIEKANMEGPLTRIAMAKMLSYYAINVLGLKPDETRNNKFNDITDELDAEYNNAVSLAYQLGIMGINMPKNNFRPNDLVTRAEFATALSRMLYKIADGKDKYYSTHLAKLMEEKIITNDNPNLQELRGYVMIMLMRSAK